MSSNIKEEYLSKKYAEYDDESDVMYKKRKHVHKKVKKSNHKHEYENVVVTDPSKDSFWLVGRCKICGKINNPTRDSFLERKFQNITYSTMWIGYAVHTMQEYEKECEDFEKRCKEHYTVYEVEGFDPLKNKYV